MTDYATRIAGARAKVVAACRMLACAPYATDASATTADAYNRDIHRARRALADFDAVQAAHPTGDAATDAALAHDARAMRRLADEPMPVVTTALDSLDDILDDASCATVEIEP